MSTYTVVEPTPSPERLGVDLRLGASTAPSTSPTWHLGAWRVAFARLEAGGRLAVEPGSLVKVVCGRLADPDRGAYDAPRSIRSTRVDGDHVTAGPDGALVAVLSGGADGPVRSPDELTIRGPLENRLGWMSFETRFKGIIDWYDGVDAHQAPGWHLLDDEGAEIAYVWTWIAGRGVDMVTHNHGNAPRPTSPAHAEVHLCLSNPDGTGGMYVTPEPGSPERATWAVGAGCEHGPFFEVDDASGLPRRRENGAVEYPWHSWQAGPDDGSGPAYDVVVPFEITAPYAQTRN